MVYTDEQLNFFKFSKLVVDEFPKALRQTFKYMWENVGPGSNWDDSEGVRDSFLTKEGGKTKVPTDKSYEEWDCTALFQATIFAQTFALPDSKGNLKTLSKLYVEPRGSMPDGSFHASVLSPVGNQAETFALAIDQLRLLRNWLSHLSSSEQINKTTFDQHTELAKDAFKALGVVTDSIDDVKSLPESYFPTEEVVRLKNEIRLMRFVTTFSILLVFHRYLKDFISPVIHLVWYFILVVILLVWYFILVVNHLVGYFILVVIHLVWYFILVVILLVWYFILVVNHLVGYFILVVIHLVWYFILVVIHLVGYFILVVIHLSEEVNKYFIKLIKYLKKTKETNSKSNENSPFIYCPQERSLGYDTNSTKMYSSVGSPHSVQVKDPKFGAVVNQQLALASNSYFEAKKIEGNENSRSICCSQERYDTNLTKMYSLVCSPHSVQVKDPKFGVVVNRQQALPSNSYFEAKKIESNENSRSIYCPQERYDTNSTKMYSLVCSPHSVQVKDPKFGAVVNRQLALRSDIHSLLCSYVGAKKTESNENSDTNSKTIYTCNSLGITHDVHADLNNLQRPLLPSNSSLLHLLFTTGTLNQGFKNLSLRLIP